MICKLTHDVELENICHYNIAIKSEGGVESYKLISYKECVSKLDLLVSLMKAEKAANIKEVKTSKIESIHHLFLLFNFHVLLRVQDSIHQYQR